MNDIKVMLKHHKIRGNYIILKYKGKEYTSDEEIETFLFTNSELYKRELVKLFRGEVFNKEVYFKKDDDAIEACEWLMDNLDRFLIMKKLVVGEI
jgi:hypothetical protein